MKLAGIGLLAFLPSPAAAQVYVDGHAFQIHGFASEAFAYSNDNNYLTMDTSKGTFAFTDAGLNVSTHITDQFRVGAQAYVRNMGELGNGHVTLDWALGDYRFSDWLGIRAGKVKTVLGLYNDTQDVEFTYTWALLPQAMYPLDLRETSLAHLGADLYGSIPLHKLGNLSYTAYAGRLPQDRSGGYMYGVEALGLQQRNIRGTARGADLKWTPLNGLLLGVSYLSSPEHSQGYNTYFGAPDDLDVFEDYRSVFSAQYTVGRFKFEGEYSRQLQKLNLAGTSGPFGPPVLRINFDRRAWYEALTYQASKHLQLGTYNSRFLPNAGRPYDLPPEFLPPAARHIYDQVITARIDFTKFWDFKIEGHFIDGYGDPSSFRGFYPQNNPQGLQPKTNLLILRMGVNF